MRASSGFYLAALAMNDCIFLILQILYELQMKWNINLLLLPVLCETFPIVFLTTQYLSPLLVLGFTVERYISVCHPFQRERYCTTRRALLTIGALLLSSLGLNAVQGYFWKYYPARSGGGSGGSGPECTVRPELTKAGMASVWSLWSWVTELTVFGVVPLTILLLNVLVLVETRRLSAREQRLCGSVKVKTHHHENGHQQRGHHNSGRHSATTFMLLAVSFYLIATTLPVTICYILYLGFPEGEPTLTDAERQSDPTWQMFQAYNSVRTIVEELGMSHYACNFYIYLCTGRIFRRQLRRLAARSAAAVCCCCRSQCAGSESSPSWVTNSEETRGGGELLRRRSGNVPAETTKARMSDY
jgi:hypothetical protein